MTITEPFDIKSLPYWQAILRTGKVQDASGQTYSLNSSIDEDECRFLSALIDNDPEIRKTLEVGCAHGISSLCISAATARRNAARHVIIDPEQNGDGWKGIGVANLRRAGVTHFELIEEPSEYALPRLAQAEGGSFDLVFIDGWHTFDHTLLDMFYANRLIRIGGYIVVDDYNWPAVHKAVSYFRNYPAYKFRGAAGHGAGWKRRLARLFRSSVPRIVGRYVLPEGIHEALYRYHLGDDSIVALQKVAVDDRRWNWYEKF